MNAKEFTQKLFGNSDSKKWGDDLKESRERASFIVNTLSKELGKRDWNLVMDLYVDMDIFSDVPEHEAHALIDQSPYPINLKNMLHETEVVDFASPHAKLSYQVSQMGAAAQNPVLRNHLLGISNRLSTGKSLEQFDYDTIKSCLLSAKEARVQPTSTFDNVAESYSKFIESFDIL